MTWFRTRDYITVVTCGAGRDRAPESDSEWAHAAGLSPDGASGPTVVAEVDDPRDRSTHELLFEFDEPVRLVAWRDLSGAYAAVSLTAGTAVLAFITGMSHLSQATLVLEGPLAPYLPPGFAAVQRILGVVIGFALGGVAVGLQRQFRLAWYGALVTLPLALLQGLASGQTTDIPLVILPLVALPIVVATRSEFDRTIDLSPIQIASLAALAGVQAYGTLGAFVLREQYNGIETLTDAFYYIVVTGTTVGYGDATPATQEAKLFTLSVLITSAAVFGAALGSLVVPLIEKQMASALGRMAPSELAMLEDHVIVLGYGPLTEPLLAELVAETDVVVVTDDEDEAADLRESDAQVLTADPADEESLRAAGIENAMGAVAATDDDAHDALAILTAKRINPALRVVAAAYDQNNADKLTDAGADSVLTPDVIGGYLIGQSVLGDTDFAGFPDRLFGAGEGSDAGTAADAGPEGGDDETRKSTEDADANGRSDSGANADADDDPT